MLMRTSGIKTMNQFKVECTMTVTSGIHEETWLILACVLIKYGTLQHTNCIYPDNKFERCNNSLRLYIFCGVSKQRASSSSKTWITFTAFKGLK